MFPVVALSFTISMSRSSGLPENAYVVPTPISKFPPSATAKLRVSDPDPLNAFRKTGVIAPVPESSVNLAQTASESPVYVVLVQPCTKTLPLESSLT